MGRKILRSLTHKETQISSLSLGIEFQWRRNQLYLHLTLTPHLTFFWRWWWGPLVMMAREMRWWCFPKRPIKDSPFKQNTCFFSYLKWRSTRGWESNGMLHSFRQVRLRDEVMEDERGMKMRGFSSEENRTTRSHAEKLSSVVMLSVGFFCGRRRQGIDDTSRFLLLIIHEKHQANKHTMVSQ